MKTWTAKLKDRDVVATTDQRRQFFSFYVSDPDLLARMSELLLFSIYVLEQSFRVSPRDVLNSIANLEAGEPPSGIKPATQFKKLPLKGIWHKHYFSAVFLVNNIILALGKDGAEKLVDEVMGQSNSPVITREMINDLTHRVVVGSFENRQADGKVTGEWLLFTKHGGKNYYLDLNTHGAGDTFIYDRIMEHCVPDFPDLKAWIAASN
jgi:hypothetical protein